MLILIAIVAIVLLSWFSEKRREHMTQKKKRKKKLTPEQVARRKRKRLRKKKEQEMASKFQGVEFVPVSMPNGSKIGGDRRTGALFASGVRSTYHLGYENRETSVLSCSDVLWANKALYNACAASDAPNCKLLHYPWTAIGLFSDGEKFRTSGMCGKLIKVVSPENKTSVIVRVVDAGAIGSDYPGGGGLDLEPSAFKALDKNRDGFLRGSLLNLQLYHVEQDW